MPIYFTNIFNSKVKNIKNGGYIMAINKSNYDEYVKKKTPNSPIFTNCIKAFLVGGIICIIGKCITDVCTMLGASKENVKIITPIILVFLGGLLTAIGVYDKLGKFAGGGSIIPITGFANSIVSSAMEFKKDESDIIYPSQTSLHNFQGECDLVQK